MRASFLPLLGFLPTTGFPSFQEATPLQSGVAVEGELEVGLFGEGWKDFVIDVPRDAVTLEVELKCEQVDLDVYVTYKGDDYEGEMLSGQAFGVERVVLDFVSEYPLRTGAYEVSVQYGGAPLPIWEGEKISTALFSLKATLHEPFVDATLEIGVPQAARVDTFARRVRSFQVEVPEDASALRFDIVETSGDLDLHARRGGPILRRGQVTHEATHIYGRESLVISRQSRPRLRPGTWYVDVVDYGARTGRVPFEILATLDPDPPAQLLEVPPPIAVEGKGPLERAAAAVVDLYAGDTQGSGTLLTEDGWILTNAHVVADFADEPVDEVVVAVPVSTERPPVESFRARVVEFDWDRDLALLHVETGFYGQPVPETYRFPSLPFADRPLRLGDRLWVLGYPWIGGSGGRVSVTLTAGIVCGFEDAGHGSLVKTDAGVSEGNSGGAAIDEDGKLIGVPTSIMENGSSQISFVVPVSSIPGAWLEHLGG